MKIKDVDTVSAWVRSCAADGKIPKSQLFGMGQIIAYCCDAWDDPVPAPAGQEGDPQEPLEYNLVLGGDALLQLLEGRTISLPFAEDGDLEVSYRRREGADG